MTVKYQNAAGKLSTLANVYTTLHETLVFAGWTLIYADSDAIGTGTSSSPKWDKAPAVSTQAGRAVYQMPSSTGLTAWFLEIAPIWGTSVNVQLVRLTTATACTVGGVLSGSDGGFELRSTQSITNITQTNWFVIAFEHGLLINVGTASTSFTINLERRRDLDGTVSDSMQYLMLTPSSFIQIFTNGTLATNGYLGFGIVRTLSGGMGTLSRWVEFRHPDASLPVAGLNRMDGSSSLPLGPYFTNGTLSGVPRLVMWFSPFDMSPSGDYLIFADGEAREYSTLSGSVVLYGAYNDCVVAFAKG